MIYYATPCGQAVCDLMSSGDLGCITTPVQGNVVFPDDGWDVIADNGCFSGAWKEWRWLRWLSERPRTIRFAVCPDVYDPDGGPCHEGTVERWERYSGTIRRMGFAPAFVCQVGSTYETLPSDADYLFIGGTDEFKLGPPAWDIAHKARADDRWVHMGRVNSNRRFRTARMLQCNSVDGTYLTFGPNENLPKLMSWLDDQDRAPMLFENL